MKSTNESGFSLVEMAIVVMIIGLLIAGSIALMRPYFKQAQANLTRKKLENISEALASYSAIYGRLPCPANPADTGNNFGRPRNMGTKMTNNDYCGTGGVGSFVGTVPFQVLGLNRDQISDSYGNLITYAVNPVMTRHDSSDDYNASLSKEQIYHACRKAGIWVVSGQNLNTNKAHVCCPNRNDTAHPALTILMDRTDTNSSIFKSERDTSQDSDDYKNPNQESTGDPVIPNQYAIIALALVSHGENGDGAYIAETSTRRPITANANAQEMENRNDNLTFVDRPLSNVMSGANANTYFDDIIVWRTNHQLVNLFGKDSCVRP